MSIKKDDLLGVIRFSELAGVSKQAIYGQLETRLEPFVVKVDDVVKIKAEALEKFYKLDLESIEEEKVDQVGQVKLSQVDQAAENNSEAAVPMYDKVLSILEKQLETKDKQIEELNRRLEDALKTIDNQQMLIDQQQKIALADRKEEIKEIIEFTQRGTLEPEEETPATVDEPSSQEEKGSTKRSLFNLFKKKE